MRAFAAALEDEDEAALEALCTPAGWTQRGDSIGRLVRQARRESLRFLPLAELVEEDRRAAICGLLSARDSGRQYGRLWLHAIRDGQWLLEGVCKNDKTAALFVSGVLPAIFDATALPPSPAAALWTEELVRDAIARPGAVGEIYGEVVARGLQTIANDSVGTLAPIGTHRIAAIERHVAGIGRRHGPDDVRQRVWFALQGSDLRVLGHSVGPGSALMLEEPAG